MAMRSMLSLLLAARLMCGGAGVRVDRKKSSNSYVTVAWEKYEGSGPPGRIPAASVACGGSLFIFGGETDSSSTPPSRYLNDLWMFTPQQGRADGTWTELSNGAGTAPAARVSSSMVCANDVLTVFGGNRFSGPLGDVWEYRLSQRKWTQVQADSSKAGGPGALTYHTATITDLVPDSMVVFGGSNGKGDLSSDVWIFSLSKRTWTLRQPTRSPPARSFHTAVAVPGSASLKTWGGSTDPKVFLYDVQTNEWSTAGDAPQYFGGRMGAQVGGKLFAFGGFTLRNGRPFYSNELVWQTPWNFWARAAAASYEAPDGRCYAAVTSLDGTLWIYGGFRRPASTERLPDLWRATFGGY